MLDGHQVVVTASIGVATIPLDGDHPDVLLQNADIALCRAKAEGRDRVRFFEPGMDAELRARKALEAELRAAIQNRELEIHYQPQVDLQGGRVTGVEALVRWNHPARGLLPAAEFIQIAEETGLILTLGAWLLPAACREVAAWPGVRLSINLSPLELRRQRPPRHGRGGARRQRSRAAAPRARDRREHAAQDRQQPRSLTLMQLKDLGVRIAIGDFGTGDSSLSYLQQLPLRQDQDRPLVHPRPRRAAAIPRRSSSAVVGLARSLGIETCAEGVERDRTSCSCSSARAATRSRAICSAEPLPAAALAAFLERAQARPPLREIEVDSAGLRA